MATLRQQARFVAVVLALLSSTVYLGRADAQSTVACGQVITESTVLANDVGPCPADGIVIGADNITLDLNGHRVFGTDGTPEGLYAGIRLAGRTGVTVTGTSVSRGTRGVVTGFDAGVSIEGGSANTIMKLMIRDNVGYGDGDLGDGVFIFQSPNNRLLNSFVTGNGPFDGVGVFGRDSSRNRIEGNRIEDNSVPGSQIQNPTLNYDIGLNLGLLLTGSKATTVSNNIIRRNGWHGVLACETVFNCDSVSSDHMIVRNDISDNGFGNAPGEPAPPGRGIMIRKFGLPAGSSTNITVADNRITGNASTGIWVFGFNRGNRFVNNYVVGNAVRCTAPCVSGQERDLFNGPPANCAGQTWYGNTYGTASPPCTTAGGTQVGGSQAAVTSAAEVADDDAVPPEAVHSRRPRSR